MTRRTGPGRQAFTLIELLVVIAIIGLLMGLLLPALSGVRIRAKEADNAAYLRAVEQGVNNFCQKFSVLYIPSHGGGLATPPAATPPTPPYAFRFRAQYPATGGTATAPDQSSFEAVYLKQVFPQLNLLNTGLPAPYSNLDADPNQVMTFFLTGINNQGFSNNKQQPFTAATPGGGEARIGPFVELRESDYENPVEPSYISTRQVRTRLLDRWGIPLAYVSAYSPSGRFDYGFNAQSGLNQLSQEYLWPDKRLTDAAPRSTGVMYPHYTGTGASLKFVNPKSFQIVSAGRDKAFGNSANNAPWTPAVLTFGQNTVGYDDFSNFSKLRLGVAE